MLSPEGLHIRAAFLQAVRQFFYQQDFLEVDTPVLHPVLIPESNIVPIAAGKNFLQTSPEICMKRILAQGCRQIFQICPCFRKEEIGRNHLEEFTMLEWYRLDTDYQALMKDCRALLLFIASRLGKDMLPRLDLLQLENDWQKITVTEAFTRFSPTPLDVALRDDLFDEILVEYIEPQLGHDSPAILYEYPIELASLAKPKGDAPNVAERFELYINGIEIANGFSELTNEPEQRERFEDERLSIEKQGRDTGAMPEKFLQCLPDISRAAGIALGLDRLLMLFLGEERVADVVSFTFDDLIG